MILKSLEIQGFKSFPDKLKLNFTKGISAVVGPNGSGKSNISDAIRWVLGEQSNKNLRGSKMEDVVFFGTATRKAVGFAEVTLTVDNSDRRIAFDSDEIAVTRRYYRSGDSEYRINGAAVRLKDIHEMLMDTGLGRDGYSIVSQGKITAVVESRSDDRREVFEEAAGIAKYRYRKNEAQRHLDKTEENLLRLRDILAELESQVEPLREQSQKAKQFLMLSEEKKDLEIGLWISSIENIKEDLREQNHKLSLAAAQHQEAEDFIDELQLEIDENFKKTNECTAKIDEIRRESSNLEENALKSENQSQILKNNLIHNNESIERIRVEISESEKSTDEMNSDIEEKNRQILEKSLEIEKYKSEISQLTEQSQSLLQGDLEFSNAIENNTKELSRLTACVSDSKVAQVAAETQISEIKARMGNVSNDYNYAVDQEKSLIDEKTDTERVLFEITENIQSLGNSLEGYKLRLGKREEKITLVKRELDETMLQAQEKGRRAKMLEDMEKNLEGFSHSVKEVIKQSERGFLRGVRGPVSQIISAKKEYATAIETALGASIQNIVTETENDAKQAISFLKKSDKGRATFLPMSSIKGKVLNQSGLSDCFGFVGIAVDLVSFDDCYKGIAQSLLGRTAVAEDIDTAVNIAKKYQYQFRIVTLDGQVVNAGGSLTGGSAVRSAHLISRRNEIETFRIESKKLFDRAEEIRASLNQITEDAASVRADIAGTQGELTTCQEDKIRFESEIKRILERLEDMKKSRAELEKESEAGAERIKFLENQKNNADFEIIEYSKAISKIEQELGLLTGDRQKITVKREGLSEKMQELRLFLLSLEKESENLKINISDIENRMKDQSDRVSLLKNEIELILNKNGEIEKEITAALEEAQRLREQSKNAAERIDNIGEMRMNLEKSAVSMRQSERDKSLERELLGRELTKLQEQKNSLTIKYDEIIKGLWDEYELTYSQAQEMAQLINEPQKAQRHLNELKYQIKLLGSVNVAAIEQYEEIYARYEHLSVQIKDVETSKAELIKMIREFTQSMKDIFEEKFNEINKNFTEIFAELFGGGTAYFELTDRDDILSSGIEIHAQPPGKSIVRLESLSGGEKSLIAISIYFAIMKVNPAPFCVLDEIEAALDDVNVDRYAAYLRRMSKNTQFIIITHRRGSMEEADVIYGVTMQDSGVSKLLELNLTDAKKSWGT